MSGIVGGINLRSSGLVNISSASDGQVFTGTGAGLPVGFEAAAGGGKLVQQVTTHSNSALTGSVIFTQDTTIPQNDEGIELMTRTITPTSATSRLRIVASVSYAPGSDGKPAGLGLFQDSTADALCVGYGYIHSANQNMHMYIDYEMAAGTTSETTFKLRGGRTESGNFYMNRSAYLWAGDPTRLYSNLTIQEIDAS